MRLATRGLRESAGGPCAVGDPWLVAQLQRQAREIHLEALLAAGLVTGLALMLPA